MDLPSIDHSTKWWRGPLLVLISHAGNGLVKKKIKNVRALSDRCQERKETKVARQQDSQYRLIDHLILLPFHKKAIKKVHLQKFSTKSKVK